MRIRNNKGPTIGFLKTLQLTYFKLVILCLYEINCACTNKQHWNHLKLVFLIPNFQDSSKNYMICFIKHFLNKSTNGLSVYLLSLKD